MALDAIDGPLQVLAVGELFDVGMTFHTFLFAVDTLGERLDIEGKVPFFRSPIFTQGNGESLDAVAFRAFLVLRVPGNGNRLAPANPGPEPTRGRRRGR